MPGKETISPWQFFVLGSIYLLGLSILTMPLGMARQDGWLAVFLAAGGAGGLSFLWGALAARFPEDTPYVYARRTLGTLLGGLVAVLYILYFVLVGSVALRVITDLYVTAVMPRTPILVFIIVLAGLAVWLVWSGLEPMARLAELLLPIVVLFILTLTLLTVITPNLAKFERLLPVLEGGMGPVLRTAVVGLAALIPFLNAPASSRRSLLGAIFLVGAFLALITLRNIVVLGPTEVGRMVYPSLTVTREINLGDFLQRIEILIIFIWTFGAFFKIAFSLYLAALGLGEIFLGGNYRPFAPGLAVVLVFLSITLWENAPQLLRFFESRYPLVALPFQVFFPALLLVVAALRGLGGGKKARRGRG